MSFNHLPPETLLHIASYLLPSQLIPFAHISSTTYQTTHSLLLPILRRQRNKKEMVRRFGKPSRSQGQSSIDPRTFISTRPDLADRFCEEIGPVIANLEYLRMNGDLHWLRPLPDDIEAENDWPQGEAATSEQIASLLDAAARMDVVIPPAFIDFLSSQEKIERIFLGGDFFYFGPGLVEVLGEDDDDGGGFVIRFLCDQQWCQFWALYVAPGGYHCVLDLGTDVHDEDSNPEQPELENAAEKEGSNSSPGRFKDVPLASERMDHELGHVDFEEWLCMRYFDGWISATLEDDERELDARQLEYLEHTWPKKVLDSGQAD